MVLAIKICRPQALFFLLVSSGNAHSLHPIPLTQPLSLLWPRPDPTGLAPSLPDRLLFEGLSPEWVSIWKVGMLRLRPWQEPQQFQLHLQGVLKGSDSITGLKTSGETSSQAHPLNP